MSSTRRPRKVKMAPGVEEVFKRHRKIKSIEKDLRAQVSRFVEFMRRDYPGEEKLIAKVLDGARDRLISEHERKKRE